MKMQGIITATVAVILVILVAIPIIDSGLYNIEKVSQENPTGYYEMVNKTEDVTVSFNNLSNKIVVNGQEISADSYGIVVISDQAFVGVIPQTSSYWQFVTTSFANKIDIQSSATTIYTGTIEASGGTMTCKITRAASGEEPTTQAEATMAYEYLFIPTTTTNSENIYCQYGNVTTTAAYVNTGAEVFVYKNGGIFSNSYQLTKVTAGSTTATINKYTLSTPGSVSTAVTGPTALDLTLTWSEVDDTDSFKLASSNTTDGDTKVAITSALVPKDYFIIKENSTSTIIKLIPVLLIVALLLGIASTMIMRRD